MEVEVDMESGEVLKNNNSAINDDKFNENKEPAKTGTKCMFTISEIKTIGSSEVYQIMDDQLPGPSNVNRDSNKENLVYDDTIKYEPFSPKTLEISDTITMEVEHEEQFEIQANEVVEVKLEADEEEEMLVELREEDEVHPTIENPDVRKMKQDQMEFKRRRSLRNETAATVKKKPPKYEEIFNCYKRKEYKECIIYIDLVAESAKDCIEYQVLKSACLINLGIKIFEAHKILDDVLKVKPDNGFTNYAKGLAYYHEEKWKQCITFFEKAIALDKPTMHRAEVLMRVAKEELEREENEKTSKNGEEDEEALDDDDENEESIGDYETASDDDDDGEDDGNEEEEEIPNGQKLTKDQLNRKRKRFTCEICHKYFGKKFNLDRHNKVMHDRETPYIPPLPRTQSQTEEEEAKSDSESLETPMKKSKSSFKIKLGAKTKKTQSVATKAGLARCKVCKKMYRKGSLARHEIIHTGNKPHQCEICPMAFYQKSDLQRHVVSTLNPFSFTIKFHILIKCFLILITDNSYG